MQEKETDAQMVSPPLPKPDDLALFANKHWDEVLSDHAAQVISITQGICLLNWNIMTKGRGKNNAFCKVEDGQREYKPRLSRIAEELARQINLNLRLAVIALQEVPSLKDFNNHFFEALNNC